MAITNILLTAGDPAREPHHAESAGPPRGPVRVLSHVALTALLTANRDADLCIRMRQTGLTHIGHDRPRYGMRIKRRRG
jgi:hypothetical protein